MGGGARRAVTEGKPEDLGPARDTLRSQEAFSVLKSREAQGSA